LGGVDERAGSLWLPLYGDREDLEKRKFKMNFAEVLVPTKQTERVQGG
jgi:hypothetical protein